MPYKIYSIFNSIISDLFISHFFTSLFTTYRIYGFLIIDRTRIDLIISPFIDSLFHPSAQKEVEERRPIVSGTCNLYSIEHEKTNGNKDNVPKITLHNCTI